MLYLHVLFLILPVVLVDFIHKVTQHNAWFPVFKRQTFPGLTPENKKPAPGGLRLFVFT
jgi:hypothetical protein